MHPSLRRDVLWYTNVRLSIRPFHMSRSNLRSPWLIHFKFHRVIGIDGILYGEIFIPELLDFIHQIACDFKAMFCMSCCKLRTPWPIHFKLRIVIGIDSLMVCILFGEISIFHSRVMGKKVFTYCMNVDDGRIMRSWRSCLFVYMFNYIYIYIVYIK